MTRPRTMPRRSTARPWCRTAIVATVTASLTVTAGLAARGSVSVMVPPPGGHAAAAPATSMAQWDWRAHAGMGSTPVSGPVTHPGADHAGSGLERLGYHRVVRRSAERASATPLGLDVSAYQSGINWSAVSTQGARFAYVKATEGTGYVSPAFGAQYNGSYLAGLTRGAYHFALPDRSSGSTQADYFIGNGGGWSADGRTLPGALDIEYNPYGAECYGLSQAGMRAWIGSFLNEYQARTSRWPVIYSTTDWWTTCTGNYGGFATKSPLWIACYCGSAGLLPAGWATYTIWQYADAGTFPGDQDVFNGDLNGPLRLAAGAGSNPAAVVGTDGTVQVYVRGTNRNLYRKTLRTDGTWSGFGALGGTWPANAAALAASGGQVYVFAVGVTGHLAADTLSGGTWSGWKDLGAVTGGLQGVPAAVQDHSGTIRVYVRGVNGHLYEVRLPPGGTWSGFGALGGTWPGNAAALAASGGQVYVFAVGVTGHLAADTLSGGTWSGWKDLGAVTGGLQSVPAAVQDHSGTIRVYVRGVNGHLYEIRLPKGGSWSAFTYLSGIWPDSPAAAVGAGGYVWVFSVGTNGALYERHLPPGGSWSGWARLASGVTGVPAAVPDHRGTNRVFARGVNGHLYEAAMPSGGSWSAMQDIGGVLF